VFRNQKRGGFRPAETSARRRRGLGVEGRPGSFFLFFAHSGRGAVGPEVLFASVPQPDPKRLRDLLFLFRGQALVCFHGHGPVDTAGGISMGIPVGTGQADQSAGLFDRIGACFPGHGRIISQAGCLCLPDHANQELFQVVEMWMTPLQEFNTLLLNFFPFQNYTQNYDARVQVLISCFQVSFVSHYPDTFGSHQFWKCR